MKKIYKIFLILAVAFMGLGVVICGGALVAADFDLSQFTRTEKDLIEQSADIPGNGIQRLVIDDLADSKMVYRITLKPSADGDFHLRYASDRTDDIQWVTEGGALRIYSPSSDWNVNIFLFNDIGQAPLTIEVPASVLHVECDETAAEFYGESLTLQGDMKCSADAAAVSLRDVSVNSLILEGDAADMELENINAVNVSVSSDFGAVTMKNITADAMEIHADTGDIDMESVFVANTMNVSVDYGSMELQDVSANAIALKADAGDIRFSSLFVNASLEVSADYGSVNGTINDAESAFTIFSEVDLGETNLRSSGSGPKTLRLKADAADADIRFLK